jgi:hypothetical protein
MAEAEPEAAQPKVKVLRRTSISPKYIKADAELQHAATQYLTAIAEFSDKLKQVEEATGRFCCRSRLSFPANSDSVALMLTLAGADDDGAAEPGPRTVSLLLQS